MKKKRKISIAWFLFFGALNYLLSNQWEMITAILAGVMIAWWVTSRIKIKLLYVCWIIFPILSIIYINPIGNRAVGWCEENDPLVIKNKIVHYFKEVDSETTQSMIDESPRVIDGVNGKIKDVFSKAVSFSKNIVEYLSEQLFKNKTPDG